MMKAFKYIKLYLLIVNLFTMVFLYNYIELFSQSGVLEPHYGVSGVNYDPIDATYDDEIWSITTQSDGKIVMVGYSSNYQWLIIRYNEDGTYDNTFNGTGRLLTHLGGLQTVKIQSDGKIIASGVDANQYIQMARFNSDGTFDTSFNGTGVFSTSLFSYSFDFKILSNGDYIVCGWNGHYVLKVKSNGTIDNSFGTNGVVQISGVAGLHLESLDIQSNGKIVVVGWDGNFNVYRLNSDGTLDNTFGTNGLLQLGAVNYYEMGKAVKVLSDDKIIVAGWNNFNQGNALDDFVLYKLNSDGTIDNTFGTNGKVITDFGTEDVLTTILVDDYNNIFAVGYAHGLAYASKYKPNGILDNSFGTNGKFISDLGYGYNVGHPFDVLTGTFTNKKDIVIAGKLLNGGNWDVFSAKITTGIIQLTTNSVSKTSQTSLRLQGNISYDGNTSVTSRGFVYSKTLTPTITTNDGIIDVGTGTGNFISTISDLTPNTNYSFRAYATNATGTYYGDIVTITTNKSDNTTDYDSDGVYDYIENLAPNNGDGNNDGILDSQQDYVASFPNVKDSTYITIVELNNNALINSKSIQSNENSYYQYPFGLVSFSVAALTSNIKIYYYGSSNLVGSYFRKKNSINKYYNFNVNYSSEIINGKSIATSTFYLTDGGIGDDDNSHNGLIFDPGGPAILAADENIPIFDNYLRIALIFTLSLFGICKVKKSVLK